MCSLFMSWKLSVIRVPQHSLKTDSKFSPGKIVLVVSIQTFLVCAKSTTMWWRHTMEMWRWKCVKSASLVMWKDSPFCVRVSTADGSSHQVQCQPPSQYFSWESAQYGYHVWPFHSSWLSSRLPPLTVVSSTPPGQHILLLPLQHLQPHLHLEDREEGKRAIKARLQWIWTQNRARWTKSHTKAGCPRC